MIFPSGKKPVDAAASKPPIGPQSSPARGRRGSCRRPAGRNCARRSPRCVRLAGEPARARRVVRKQERQLLVEFEVVADDRGHGRAHRLGARCRRIEMRPELLLRLRGLHEDEARRASVGAGRAAASRVRERVQRRFADVRSSSQRLALARRRRTSWSRAALESGRHGSEWLCARQRPPQGKPSGSRST